MRNVCTVTSHGRTMQIRVDNGGTYHTFYGNSRGNETGKTQRTLPSAKRWARKCNQFWAGKGE